MIGKTTLDLQVNSQLDKISNDLFHSVEERVTRASLELHNKLVRNLTGQRAGNVYSLPWGRGTWTASRPGEIPAVRLGDLRTSYRPHTDGKGFEAVGMVGSPLDYAVYLEKGTSRMAPRPHLSRTFEENKEQIKSYFQGLLE